MTTDSRGRPLGSLRLSVTDRCNLRCSYCMPEDRYTWLPKQNLLRFEETCELVDVFVELGVSEVRLTGGEPLVRARVEEMVRMLASRPGIKDIAMTTNGVLLADRARGLRAAGLQRLTVSLDTLRPDRFLELTRRDGLSSVLAGIDSARQAGFSRIKLNTVVMRGFNDDEIEEIIDYSRHAGVEARLIEYMDVGGATRWAPEKVVPKEEILDRVARRFGPLEQLPLDGPAPAERYVLGDGTVFGVISSVSKPFCRACDRSRLTADGMWFLCLYARKGVDLGRMLRDGATPERIRSTVQTAWSTRCDHGAEERTVLPERSALAGEGEMAADPHLGMHTRGG
ncbi:MAG: GTP 3',8-cyclase MoaA [Candidatus Riflebacteria bacterium]|nr:GTP 3',8-cyclase MoaA [Candidatus Riflebacteria bacterium]